MSRMVAASSSTIDPVRGVAERRLELRSPTTGEGTHIIVDESTEDWPTPAFGQGFANRRFGGLCQN